MLATMDLSEARGLVLFRVVREGIGISSRLSAIALSLEQFPPPPLSLTGYYDLRGFCYTWRTEGRGHRVREKGERARAGKDLSSYCVNRLPAATLRTAC
jgi:hypothetical protein